MPCATSDTVWFCATCIRVGIIVLWHVILSSFWNDTFASSIQSLFIMPSSRFTIIVGSTSVLTFLASMLSRSYWNAVWISTGKHVGFIFASTPSLHTGQFIEFVRKWIKIAEALKECSHCSWMQLYEPNFKSILGDTVPHAHSVMRSCNIGHTVWFSGGRFERKARQVCDEPLSDGILFNSSTSMHKFEIKNEFETFYL